MMTHIEVARLNDLIDDSLAAEERATLNAHLADCAMCSSKVRAMQDVQASLHALPRSIEPRADLLPGIRARVHRMPLDVAAMQVEPRGEVRERARALPWPLLIAAAAVLCVLSSVATLLITRSGRGDPAVTTAPVPIGEAQLVELRATEARYQDAIEELRAALLRDQSLLAPETVQLLEQSLATIDRALSEARTALAADPANALLAEMLQANYEKKLDLLRRASAHARVRL
jgi:anti-sigma factor RsiW